MSSLQNLPCELLLTIMEYSGPGLISLINAYPIALVCFSRNRDKFTKAIASHLYASYGIESDQGLSSVLPSLMVAARLRHQRKHPPSDLSVGMVRAQLRAFTKTYTTEAFWQRPKICDRLSLSALCTLLAVGEDAEMSADMYPMPASSQGEGSQNTEVLNKQRRRILNAASHFEACCLAFLDQDESLFGWEESWRRQQLFSASMTQCEWGNEATGVLRFYCILCYVIQKHGHMISDVATYLRRGPVHFSLEPEDRTAKEYFLCRTERETLTYVRHMAFKGLGTLKRLEGMSIEELTAFTLPNFHRVSTTQHPARRLTSIVSGFVPDKGERRPRAWQVCDPLDSCLAFLVGDSRTSDGAAPWTFPYLLGDKALHGIWGNLTKSDDYDWYGSLSRLEDSLRLPRL
ncbi:hypothetical protein FLONG3_9780 [Fusarium longipes]|uniref:Uncharacterized protein n=1 Tax=Fusarium longipes TaxID=694270 RepID=A0A395RUP9_9HYPO|nr:hypothetical protein FLONG3_9780 [Fusarium longipes]